MRRPNLQILAAMRTLAKTPMPLGMVPADSPEARILGLVPYTPRPEKIVNNNAERDSDMVVCDECHDELPWTEAVHRPFGIYCTNPQCEINGRRAHDGLPVDEFGREIVS